MFDINKKYVVKPYSLDFTVYAVYRINDNKKIAYIEMRPMSNCDLKIDMWPVDYSKHKHVYVATSRTFKYKLWKLLRKIERDSNDKS